MNDHTLLTYAVATSPTPLQISTLFTKTTGTMKIAVYNPQKVYCKAINITIPYGDTYNALFSQPPSISVNTSKWIMTTMRQAQAKDLGLLGDSEVDFMTFYLTCNEPEDYQINYALVFSIQGPVNTKIGEAEICLEETSTKDPKSWPEDPYSYSFTLAKSVPEFYVKNFVAATTDNPTVPCSEFGNGKGIRLSWESNGTFFRIYKKNEAKPIYEGNQTTFTLNGGLKTDTTFILVASMTGDPSQDKSQAGYAPIYIYDSLTITITDPDLTPKSITAGALSVTSTSTLSGNTSIGGALSVTGGLAVQTNALMVANGNVGIGTPDSPATLRINGNVEVNKVGCLFLDGNNGYVELPPMDLDLSKGFTIEVWVRYHSFKNWSRIIDFGNGQQNGNILLSNEGKTNNLVFHAYDNTNKVIDLTADGVLEENTWIHLAVVITNEDANIYKNGTLSINKTKKDFGRILKKISRKNNYIGKSNWKDDEYLDGRMRELRIWGVARKPEEISNNLSKQMSGNEPNLVAYYRLDPDNKANDLTQKHYKGTPKENASFFYQTSLFTNHDSGNVGIGTATPEKNLHVNGDVRVDGKISCAWIFLRQGGQQYGGEFNIFHTHNLGNTPYRNRLEIGYRPAQGKERWEQFVIDGPTGNVGIGTATPDKKLVVAGDIKATGGISCGGNIGLKNAKKGEYLSSKDTTFCNVSWQKELKEDEYFTLEMPCSRDFKENIDELTTREALTTLAKLNPIKYDYKGEKSFRQNLGFIAEEMPDNLASFDRKSISPFEVIPILTKVVQEQQRTLVKLESLVKRVLQVDNP
ncbi:MAG: LamG-like jellyroll fold domain-containing protein [Candidatus Competibacteraceae bacterium]